MKNYETEARERWGESGAYRECEERTKSYTKKKWAEANDGMMAIFAACATCKANGASPGLSASSGGTVSNANTP